MLRAFMFRQGAHHVNSSPVLRVEGPLHVPEAPRQQALDEGPLLGQLSDHALPFLGVNVQVRARDVEVAAQDQRIGPGGQGGRVGVERREELHLGLEVLAAVGHVDRGHGQSVQVHHRDASLEVERRVHDAGPSGVRSLRTSTATPEYPLSPCHAAQ